MVVSFRDNNSATPGLRSGSDVIANVTDGAVNGAVGATPTAEYGIGFGLDMVGVGLTQSVPYDASCIVSGSGIVSNPAMAITTTDQPVVDVPFPFDGTTIPVDLVVCFSAKIKATTPAGSYAQQVIFTAVGRF
jgi:hypothetical protein